MRPRAARSTRVPSGCADQLKTPEEMAKIVAEHAADAAETMEEIKMAIRISLRMAT